MYINQFSFFLQNKISLLQPDPLFPPDKLANMDTCRRSEKQATDQTSQAFQSLHYCNTHHNIHVSWQIEVVLF